MKRMTVAELASWLGAFPADLPIAVSMMDDCGEDHSIKVSVRMRLETVPEEYRDRRGYKRTRYVAKQPVVVLHGDY